MPYKDGEKQKEYQKNWYISNKEKLSKRYNEYRLNNKDKVSKCNKEYYLIRQQSGLCTNCGRNIIDFNRSIQKCECCLDKINVHHLERINKLLSKNICIKCGKQPINFLRSMRLCTDCLNRRNYIKMKLRGITYSFYHELELAAQSLKEEMVNNGNFGKE